MCTCAPIRGDAELLPRVDAEYPVYGFENALVLQVPPRILVDILFEHDNLFHLAYVSYNTITMCVCMTE